MSILIPMARKKADPEPSPRREDYVRVRMTPQFKAWLEELAESNQLKMSDTIVQALIAMARAQGFKQPPPEMNHASSSRAHRSDRSRG
jgi:hypothetical protein